MKRTIKYFITLIALLLTLSCSTEIVMGVFDRFEWNGQKFNSIDEVAIYVRINVEYKLDIDHFGVSEYWANPEYTSQKMIGDCDDKAILLMAIIYKELGIESELVSSDEVGGHATVLVGNTIYFPTTCLKMSKSEYFSKYKINKVYSMDEVSRKIINHHYKLQMGVKW